MPPGTRLGPYEVVAPLGVGGMGEVYRATDSRLKRQVAIKILPAALAADPDRLARFQREAEVLASLNHPHIAAVYGLEDIQSAASGHAGKALVMELVEGPTLADRISQGPLPVDEALAIARQIAAALEAAHEQGIVHRDLKPANIKVREDGTVKVLDFGLAKLTDAGVPGRATQVDLSNSPTLTAAARTDMGIILGTAAYMSPEQARGRVVDKRTDVWAFGAVLYELLTGARAFDGEDVTEMMASVVKSTPNWAALPADVPPHVVTLIQRCLEKDRSARIGDIAVARFLLSDHGTLSASPAAVASIATATAQPSHQRLSWALRTAAAGTLGAVLAGALVSWVFARRPADSLTVMRLQMSVSPAEQLIGSRVSGSFRPVHTAIAISPDGRRVVFAGARQGTPQLYSREIDRAEATPLPGTEGGDAPFFSPDGAWIGFWTGNTLKKVSAAGGPPATIVEAPAGLGWGAGWGDDDTIVFARDAGIFKVSSAGGAATAVTRTPGGERHLLPQPLAGGDAILFTKTSVEDQSGRRWGNASVVLQLLDGGEPRVLIPGGADARYVNTGHLAFMKSGTLMAVSFDAGSRQVRGAPVALAEGVMQSVNTPNTDDETGAGQFVVSNSGTLLYATGGISPVLTSRLVWVDRKGAVTPLANALEGSYSNARISPDGQKIAVAAKGGVGENRELWVYDVVRGAPTRLTFEGASAPTWSPDGKRILFNSDTLYTIRADGSGKPVALAVGGIWPLPSSWSAANAVVYVQKTQSGANGIWVLPMDAGATPRLFLESRFEIWHPDLSPDGRWMAYVSFESGTPEVYVQAYPDPGEKIRISTAAGFDPLWTKGGRELLFRSGGAGGSQHVLSSTIRSLAPFRADPPRLLFESKFGEYDSTAPERSWDVSADGERMLMLQRVASTDKPVTVLHVVLNWAEELRQRVPAK